MLIVSKIIFAIAAGILVATAICAFLYGRALVKIFSTI